MTHLKEITDAKHASLATNNPEEALKHIRQARTVGERIEEDEANDWLYQNLDVINSLIDG